MGYQRQRGFNILANPIVALIGHDLAFGEHGYTGLDHDPDQCC